MVAGGLVLESLTEAELKEAKLGDDRVALKVKHVGQYGPHAAAQKAGFRKGDLVVGFDDQNFFGRETDLLSYALRQRQVGDQVNVTVLRDGKRLTLQLPMQP